MNRGLGDTNREGERRNGHVHDLLYAYIDGSLDKPGQEVVRRHLQTCPDCRGDFIELKAARQLLKSLPMAPPPRAFTLTPEMVSDIKPKPGFWESFFVPRNAPRFAFGSALSLVIMMLVLFAGPVGREMTQTPFTTASAPAAAGMQSADTPPSLYSKQASAPTDTAGAASAASANSAAAPTQPAGAASGATSGSAQDQSQPGGGAASVGAAAAEATASPAAAAGALSGTAESHSAPLPPEATPPEPSKVIAPLAATPATGVVAPGQMDNPTTTALSPGPPPAGTRNSTAGSSAPSSGSNSGVVLVSLGVGLGVLSLLLAVFAVVAARKRV